MHDDDDDDDGNDAVGGGGGGGDGGNRGSCSNSLVCGVVLVNGGTHTDCGLSYR